MTLQLMGRLLMFCTLINYGILLVWFLVFVFARDWMRDLHGKWFDLSRERFDAIHYAGMAGYKLLIMVFNLVPWIAVSIAA